MNVQNDSCVISINSFSEINGWEFLTPSEMMEKFLDGTLEKFDFVFSYSSVEHTGLGNAKDCQGLRNYTSLFS